MKTSDRWLRVVLHVVLCLVLNAVLVGCGDDGSSKPRIDLSRDNNNDGVPDDFEVAYQAAMKIAEGGDSVRLDEDEVDPFGEALNDLQERLPYSDEARQLFDELAVLSVDMLFATEAAEFAAIQEDIRLKMELLEMDPTYRLVQQSLDLLKSKSPSPAKSARRASVDKATALPLVDFTLLQPGDLMFNKHRVPTTINLLYARDYGHGGMYAGNNLVYESGTADGVTFKPLQEWKEDGMTVAFARSKTRSQQQVLAAMDWALATYGKVGGTKRTPYNIIIPDKYSDDQIYCSQLQWKVFDYLDVDIDSNNAELIAALSLNFGSKLQEVLLERVAGALGPIAYLKFGAELSQLGSSLMPRFVEASVLPDEVALSDQLSVYFVGINPTIIPPTVVRPQMGYTIAPGGRILIEGLGAQLPAGQTGVIEYRYRISWSDQQGVFWRPAGVKDWSAYSGREITVPREAAGGYLKIEADARQQSNTNNMSMRAFTFAVPKAGN